MDNLLTFEEVKNFLEAEQQEVEKYIKQGKLRAYKIGGTYLRFRKEEVLNLRVEILPKKTPSPPGVSVVSRLGDFWRFNNFYIISLLLVIVIVLFVIQF